MALFQIPCALFERILAARREQVYDAGFRMAGTLLEEHDIQEGLKTLDPIKLGSS